ncbi:MGMT family protein [Facilibium subflavum]|uniref:MGMT family protein n=1 Tax=Facilibium subflavum TaxID=2219058 RepID=UPI000E656249|nr:MGMT family protein [Facilibium subflavum]
MLKITFFQQRVYDALQKIPPAKVTTYALLAKYLQCGSAQAIGQALKRNPNAPLVPCHRVVKSDLSIGGYSGHTEGQLVEKKLALLKQEGVLIDQDNRVDPSCVFDFKNVD